MKFCKLLPNINHLEKLNKTINYEEFIDNDFNIAKSQFYLGSIILSLIFCSICSVFFYYVFRFGFFSYVLGFFIAFGAYRYLTLTFDRYYELKKERIESIIPLVNSFFELYQIILPENSDNCFYFIKVFSEFNSPIKNDFQKFLKLIRMGQLPEDLLRSYRTYSSSLKKYINNLLINNFYSNSLEIKHFRDLEDKYIQFSKSLENRISLIFFFGIFFPIGLGFLTILQKISPAIILSFVFGLLFLLHHNVGKFLSNNQILFGILDKRGKETNAEYNNMLQFLILLSSGLKIYNPEQAICYAYEKSEDFFTKEIKLLVKRLKSFRLSLESFLDALLYKLKGKKAKILLHLLKIMLIENSYQTSSQLNILIAILNKHSDLEKERNNIFRGHFFKLKIFQLILPIIIGIIAGIIPFLVGIFANFGELTHSYDISIKIIDVLSNDAILIILSEFVMVNLSIFYFVKMLGGKYGALTFIITATLFLLSMMISFYSMNSVSFSSLF